MWRKCGRLVALLSAAAICAGCGESLEPVYPVQGTVTLNGKTLATGTVMFVPVEKGPAVTGNIRIDGTYQLSTHDDRLGAPAGKYKVSVSAVRISPIGIATSFLPGKYSTAQTSGLTAVVEKSDKNVVDLELTGKPG